MNGERGRNPKRRVTFRVKKTEEEGERARGGQERGEIG